MIDATADQPHYVDHLAPIWAALPEALRGRFHVPRRLDPYATRHGITVSTQPDDRGRLLLAASARELRRDRHEVRVMLEHGAGQTYSGAHPWGYADGDCPWVDVFLIPAQRLARLRGDRARVVGCPKLDECGGVRRSAAPDSTGAVVAFAWHWDCPVAPEAGTAWQHHAPGLERLARTASRPYRIAGHAHPRAARMIRGAYDDWGLPWWDADQVLRYADVLVADNTSLAWEFATLDRPIVWMNAPHWRRDVHHGLRFWTFADIGEQVDEPDQLGPAVVRALRDDPHRHRRRAAIPQLYAHLGTATPAAVAAIVEAHG